MVAFINFFSVFLCEIFYPDHIYIIGEVKFDLDEMMSMVITFIKTLVLSLLFTLTTSASAPAEVVSRIAFGSCANQSSPQVSQSHLFFFIYHY